MTKTEYTNLYIKARNAAPYLTRAGMKTIHAVYKEAGKIVSEKIAAATLSGKNSLTIDSWTAIEEQLSIGAEKIRQIIETEAPAVVSRGVQYTSNINSKYILSALKDSDIHKVSAVGVRAVYTAINDHIISSVINRVWQDGYTFSSRVWKTGLAYQQQIRNVISVGLAQARDPIKIARDVQVYIKDGKIALANRFGANMIVIRDGQKRINWKAFLEKHGTEATVKAKAFMKRIGNKIDWRALRIVRSELYASLQEAAGLQGQANPGCNGLYDWVMERGRAHWDCACPDISSNSPYRHEAIPGYPHANCRCSVRPQLRDRKTFINDLKKWGDNEPIPYLDTWYRENIFKLSA